MEKQAEKIIDFRVRPPYRSFKTSKLFTRKPRSEEKWGLPTDPSIIEESMELFIREMDAAHVVKALVPPRRAFGIDNADLVALMQAYPERFIGCPCLDPNLDLSVALKELDDYVINGPCTAIMMEPGKCTEPIYSNDERIYPIYEKCQKEGITVLLSHGGFIPPDMSYNNPMHIDQIAKDFPDLRLVVCHAGWPFAAQMVHVAFSRPNIYIMPDMYMVNCAASEDYIKAANYMISDKLIFGSAYPIMSFQPSIDYIKANVRPEVHQKIFYDNAMRALGLVK